MSLLVSLVDSSPHRKVSWIIQLNWHTSGKPADKLIYFMGSFGTPVDYNSKHTEKAFPFLYAE